MTAVAEPDVSRRTAALADRLRAAVGTERVLTDRTQVRTEYDNVFMIRFDDAGRATDFTEWFIEKPKQPGA